MRQKIISALSGLWPKQPDLAKKWATYGHFPIERFHDCNGDHLGQDDKKRFHLNPEVSRPVTKLTGYGPPAQGAHIRGSGWVWGMINGASAFSSYMIQTVGPYKQTGLAQIGPIHPPPSFSCQQAILRPYRFYNVRKKCGCPIKKDFF